MPRAIHPTSLLQTRPSSGEIRATWIVMGALLLGCLVTIPYAARQWPPSHLLYAAAGIATFAEIATGLLLLSQAMLPRDVAGWILGLGYLAGGLVILINLLWAPGVATSLWLFRLWHGVFVFAVLLYALTQSRYRVRLRREVFRRWTFRLSLLALLFIAALISYLVNRPFPLPPIIHRGNYTTIPDVVVNGVQLAAMMLAWLLLVTARRKTTLSIWMAVVACAVSIDIVLFVLGTKLFSVGLYVSKLNNLLAGTLIFAIIFYRHIQIQAELQRHRVALIRANRRLSQIAHTDPLTDLPNRMALDQHLQGALARAARTEGRLAVCLIDIDDFKPVNDQYGHEMGDQLLRRFSKRLSAVLRVGEYFARFGGDEFVLVLEGIDEAEALSAVMKRIDDALLRPFALGPGVVVRAEVSIGVSLCPDQCRPRALLRAADEALYRAKAQKRTRSQPWVVFREGGVPVETERSQFCGHTPASF